tara:strand:- start:33 stop:434 length:402 start_codon:yes stop_codon:yes gene_type:complete
MKKYVLFLLIVLLLISGCSKVTKCGTYYEHDTSIKPDEKIITCFNEKLKTCEKANFFLVEPFEKANLKAKYEIVDEKSDNCVFEFEMIDIKYSNLIGEKMICEIPKSAKINAYDFASTCTGQLFEKLNEYKRK